MPDSDWTETGSSITLTATTTTIDSGSSTENVNYLTNADKITLMSEYAAELTTKTTLDELGTTWSVDSTYYDNAVALISTDLIAAGAPSDWATTWPDGTTSGPWTGIQTTLSNLWAQVASQRTALQSSISSAQAAAAEATAISTAAADATTKANAAYTKAYNDAVAQADTDAQTYANNAKTEAISSAVATAASDATSKANAAQSAAEASAATDATTKANNAEAAAISSATSTAAADATTKANAAEATAYSTAVAAAAKGTSNGVSGATIFLRASTYATTNALDLTSASIVSDSSNGSSKGDVVTFTLGWAVETTINSTTGFGAGSFDLYARARTNGAGNSPTSLSCGVYDATTSANIVSADLTVSSSYSEQYIGRVTFNSINNSHNIVTYFSVGDVTTQYYLDYVKCVPTVNGTSIAANTITSDLIAAGAITTSALAAGAVTATTIAAGAVTAASLALTSASLIPDTDFASGANGWSGFIQRLLSSNSSVPSGCPGIYAAQFDARDSLNTSRVQASSGEQYLATIFCHPNGGSEPGGIGIVAYQYNSSGTNIDSYSLGNCYEFIYGAGDFSSTPEVYTFGGNIDWGNSVSTSGALPTGVSAGYNYARFTGYIIPTVSGTYTVGVNSDDGANLYINGGPVVSNLSAAQSTNSTVSYTQSGTVAFTAGVRYPFVLEWQNGTGNYEIELLWTPPGGSVAVIPSSSLTGVVGAWWNGTSSSWYPTGTAVYNTWRQVVATMTVVSNAVSISIGAWIDYSTFVNGSAGAPWFTNITFRKSNDATLIVDGSITANSIAAGAITTDTLAANSVTTAKIASASITTDLIAAGAVTASTIATGTITATQIAGGTITATQLAADSVTATQIAAGSVSTDELAANSVTTAKIASASITTDLLAAGSVTTNALAAGAVTASSLNVGDTTNLIKNGSFASAGSGWNGALSYTTVNGGITYYASVEKSGSGEIDLAPSSSAGYISVTPGDVLVISTSCRLNSASATPTAGICGFYGNFFNDAGVYVAAGDAAIGCSSLTTTAVTLSSDATVPTGATYLVPYFFINGDANGGTIVDVLKMSCVKQVSTTTIEDGAITTAKIAANTITAGNIAAGAITASMITSGTLDASVVTVTNLNASNITTGTLSASKVLFSDGSALTTASRVVTYTASQTSNVSEEGATTAIAIPGMSFSVTAASTSDVFNLWANFSGEQIEGTVGTDLKIWLYVDGSANQDIDFEYPVLNISQTGSLLMTLTGLSAGSHTLAFYMSPSTSSSGFELFVGSTAVCQRIF